MLCEWLVLKRYENGGCVEGTFMTQYKCPLGHINPRIEEEFNYPSSPAQGRKAVFDELAKFRPCIVCGVVMGLTEEDQKKIKERMGDKAPHLV